MKKFGFSTLMAVATFLLIFGGVPTVDISNNDKKPSLQTNIIELALGRSLYAKKHSVTSTGHRHKEANIRCETNTVSGQGGIQILGSGASGGGSGPVTECWGGPTEDTHPHDFTGETKEEARKNIGICAEDNEKCVGNIKFRVKKTSSGRGRQTSKEAIATVTRYDCRPRRSAG